MAGPLDYEPPTPRPWDVWRVLALAAGITIGAAVLLFMVYVGRRWISAAPARAFVFGLLAFLCIGLLYVVKYIRGRK